MKSFSAVAFLVLVCCAVRKVDCCANSGDCAANECCVSRFQLDGKRQANLDPGYCRSLARSGDGCLVNQGTYEASTHASRMYYSCPCQDGLTCEGSGQYEVPLGEYGTCAQIR